MSRLSKSRPAKKRRFHRGKISGRYAIEKRHRATLFVAGDPNVFVPTVTAHRHDADVRGGIDTGNRANTLQQIAFEFLALSSRDVVATQVERRDDRVLLAEAGIEREQVSQRANEQQRADKEHQRECATCETTSARRRPKRSRPAVMPREAVFSTVAGRDSRGAQRRSQTEKDAREYRQRCGETRTRANRHCKSMKSGEPCVLMNATRKRLRRLASHGTGRRADRGEQ